MQTLTLASGVEGTSLPTRPAALVFDVGNTLLFLDYERLAVLSGADSVALETAEPLAKAAYERAMKRASIHESGWRVFMRAMLLGGGVLEADVEARVIEVEAAHLASNLWTRARAGTHEALESLSKARLPMAIVSNSEGRVAELLESAGLAHFFIEIVDSGVTGIAKPDPQAFAPALAALGEAPEDVIYIGDVPDVDVSGAEAAGMQAVLFDPAKSHVGFARAPRIESLSELVSVYGDGACGLEGVQPDASKAKVLP